MSGTPRRFLLLAALIAAALWLPGRAGMTAVYPLLGLLPGLALVRVLRPRWHAVDALIWGAALSPLASALTGWAAMLAGVPIRTAALAIVAAGALGVLAPRRADAAAAPQLPRPVILLAAVMAALVLVPPLFNPWISMRGDAWTHTSIVYELLERGIPPQDPRFAGIGLNYVWCFNLFIAMLCAVRGDTAFWFMSLFNAATMLGIVSITALLAQRAWGSRHVALPAAALLCVGLNAGAWLLTPLNGVRAFLGTDRGFDQLPGLLFHNEIGTSRVIYHLAAPMAQMVSFLDKMLVGTAVGYGYLMMALFLVAVVASLRRPTPLSLLAVAGCSGGMLFMHTIVGLSVVPVAIGALALGWLLRARVRWLPDSRTLLAIGVATAAGAALAMPSTLAMLRGWTPDKTQMNLNRIEFRWVELWTLATATGVVAWLAARPLRDAWRHRHPVLAWLTLDLLGMCAFALLVKLPENNQIKFVFEAFLLLVVLAAPAAVIVWDALARRPVWRTVVAALLLLPPALTLHGFLCEPSGRTARELHPGRGDEALEAWLRTKTPATAVVVDNAYRDLLMIAARRRLFLGSSFGPERSAFPMQELMARRAAIADLYGDGRDFERSAATLRPFGDALYIVYRDEDLPGAAPAESLVASRPDAFSRVYDQEGVRVYQARSVTP